MHSNSRDQFVAKVRAAWPEGQILSTATVLWEGWEMDNYVALVAFQPGEKVLLLTTDHGMLSECSVQELRDAVSRHEEATSSIYGLLFTLETQPHD